MQSLGTWATVAAFTLAGIGVNADDASARVEAGMLTCEVGKGFALIISKPRDLHCVFHKSNGQNEAYAGKLREVGLDIGVSGRGVIAWGVIAATTELAPGELAGTYAGVEVGAAAVVGGRGQVMVGGANRTISLQPLSVEAETGINIAVGVTSMSLHPLMTGRPSAGTHAPAVGLSYAAVPHAQQIPHYGCGSYTHLQRGQTLSGLAHACGVTVEALLDANPQITNVRDIDAGALVHLPTHVGHHDASPCGEKAILQDNESLDHLAWRCGITLHALLLDNPSLRNMAMVEPGLVLAIPEKGAPATQPPVQYAMTAADLLPPEATYVSQAPAAVYPVQRAQTRESYVPEEDFFEVALASPGSYLNVHSAPSPRASTIGNFRDGTVLRNVGGCQYPGGRQWCDVQPSGGGVRGWVVGELLTVPGPRSGGAAASRPSAPTGGERVSTDAAAQACVGHASNQFGVSMSAFRVISSLGSSEGTGVEIVATDGRQGRCFVGPTGEVINFEASGGETARAPSRAVGATTNSDGTDMQASAAYDQGCAAGTEDANVNMSMAHERHSGEYDSQYEDTFRAGYEKCWTEYRQEAQKAPPPEASAADDGGGAMAGSQSSSDVSDAAMQACLSAVSSQTEGDVAVLSSEFSEANSLVMVGVGADRAPWRCLVSNDGTVQEIYFAGSEGAL